MKYVYANLWRKVSSFKESSLDQRDDGNCFRIRDERIYTYSLLDLMVCSSGDIKILIYGPVGESWGACRSILRGNNKTSNAPAQTHCHQDLSVFGTSNNISVVRHLAYSTNLAPYDLFLSDPRRGRFQETQNVSQRVQRSKLSKKYFAVMFSVWVRSHARHYYLNGHGDTLARRETYLSTSSAQECIDHPM